MYSDNEVRAIRMEQLADLKELRLEQLSDLKEIRVALKQKLMDSIQGNDVDLITAYTNSFDKVVQLESGIVSLGSFLS